MHIHSRQLRKDTILCTDGRKDKAVPSWVPPPFIIPLIDKDKKKDKRAPVEQPRVEIEDDEPLQPPPEQPDAGEGYKDPQKDRAPKDKDEERGIWEIQF